MISTFLIGMGYVGLVWAFGWTGFAAMCLHLVIMLIATHRSRP